MKGPDVSLRPGPEKHLTRDPIGLLAFDPPPRGTLVLEHQPSSVEIVEETITAKIYNAYCDRCRRHFRHRDKATLLSNIAEHNQRWHGAGAENRLRLEYVKKELGRIRIS